MEHRKLRLWLLLAIITTAQAQWGGWNGGDNGYPGSGANSPYGGSYGGGNSGSGSGSDGDGDDDGGFDSSSASSFAGFDVDAATRHMHIHGILAAVAFVILFPLGAIFVRVIPGRFALWIHALAQLVAYVLFIAAVALGIMLVQDVRIPFGGGSLLTNPSTSYHPIIGIVVFVFLFLQGPLGYIHHARFKKLQRRTIWSYLHLFNGRVMVVLGIVNGGLGLRMAGASDPVKLAYTIVAAIFGGFWVAFAVLTECRRRRRDTDSASVRMERIEKAVRQHSGQSGHSGHSEFSGSGHTRYSRHSGH